MVVPGRYLRILALIVLCAIVAAPASALIKDSERRTARLVNQERAERGLRRVDLREGLSDLARRHSRRMAERGDIFHSFLSRYGCSDVAENVGMGSSVRAVHNAFMASGPHRDVILRAKWRRLGVGIVKAGGLVWVTEVFCT